MTWVRWWRCLHTALQHKQICTSGAYNTVQRWLLSHCVRSRSLSQCKCTGSYRRSRWRHGAHKRALRVERIFWPTTSKVNTDTSVLVKFLNMTHTAPKALTVSGPRVCQQQGSRFHVCVKSVTEQCHHYYLYLPSVKGAQMFKKARIELKILGARSKFQSEDP
jgi:hypothetical protein